MLNKETIVRVNLVDLAGGVSTVVDAAMDLWRSLWRLTYERDTGAIRKHFVTFEQVVFERWKSEFIKPEEEQDAPLRRELLDRLEIQEQVKKSEDGTSIRLNIDCLQPYKLVEIALANSKLGSQADREYFMWRNIRRRYRYEQSSDVAHVFSLLARALNSRTLKEGNLFVTGDFSDEFGTFRKQHSSVLDYQKGVSQPLIQLLEADEIAKHSPEKHRCVFLEACRMAGYFSPHPYAARAVWFHTVRVDPEFLLSRLFGLATQIPGFDSLFGGGGIALAESCDPSASSRPVGRVILIRGRFGTGKSSLALSLAAEVARKQGLAWVMPLEQTSKDCAYYLESVNALLSSDAVTTVESVGELAKVMGKQFGTKTGDSERVKERGIVILLQTQKSGLAPVFESVLQKATATTKFPLRILVLDPINSIPGWESGEQATVRAELMEKIEFIKKSGANLLLVAEDDNGNHKHDKNSALRFVDNIADTVIELTVDRRHGYSQRYMEVLKSRFQRDQRGEHPFSIKAGVGVTVFPSSAALLPRVRSRRIKGNENPTKFGWEPLDCNLGKEALFPGDVVVVRGGEATYKTHIGMLFLLGSDFERKIGSGMPRRSLIIPILDNPAIIQHHLRSGFVQMHRRRHPSCKADDQIRVVQTPVGFVQPGAIFQILEDEFARAFAEGKVIDRVVIDNLFHWELSCPFVREDETFADTLIEFLRRQQVTTLLICSSKSGHPKSVFQSSVVDLANTIVELGRTDIKGSQHVNLRVIKTRGMRHTSDTLSVFLTDDGLELNPVSKLLRTGGAGEPTSVWTRLYLHEEHKVHADYNATILESITPVLSRNIEINSRDRTHVLRALHLSQHSIIDELQILQLDEFQLPELSSMPPRNLLHNFSASRWDSACWHDMSPHLLTRVKQDDGSFFAIPYYNNIGLLVCTKDIIDTVDLQDWESIATACKSWEKSQSDASNSESVFFYFPSSTDENYNCLFFEILLSLGATLPTEMQEAPKSDLTMTCRLKCWLNDHRVNRACVILRTLCRRVHMISSIQNRRSNDDSSHGSEAQARLTGIASNLAESAIISRHWFSTLPEIMGGLDANRFRNIMVRPLPKHQTVSGEWYLGVPVYSAAPDVGLEVIKILTTREEELERLRLGLGLPTRESYYAGNDAGSSHPNFYGLSRKLVGEMIRNSFRRSTFSCYSQVSRIISFHLKRIIEFSESAEVSTELLVNQHLDALKMDICFVLDQESRSQCSKCNVR